MRFNRKQRKAIREFRKQAVHDLLYFLLCGVIFYGLVQSLLPSISKIKVSITPVINSTPRAYAKEKPSFAPPPPTDTRAKRLYTMLQEKGSPFADYAQLIVNEADKYDIGWTRLYAISGIESKFGTLQPDNSYNAWGIGGDKFMYFGSWEEGIKYESQLLGENYQYNANAGIKEKYCPASDNCNPAWADLVTGYSQEVLGE